MQVSAVGLALIKQFEGLRLEAYLDMGGVPTIGYGSTRGVKLGETITPEEADRLLAADVDMAARDVTMLVKAPLQQNQFDALTSFVFNLGWMALEGSNLLQKLNARDYDGAAAEFGKWCHAAGKVVPGLFKRRMAERTLFTAAVVSAA